MSTIVNTAKAEASRYKAGHDLPLAGYAGLMGAYGGVVVTMGFAVKRLAPGSSNRLAWGDLALLALATQRLARLITKDPVTSPIRAPFTRFERTDGPAQLAEEVRGHGPRKAVGEMLSCPFCLGQWVATFGVFGMMVAPRWTRLLASALAVGTAADTLQLVYGRLQD